MTDFEKTIKLFSELGIGFKTYKKANRNSIELIGGAEKIGGMSGASSTFFFDKTGSFDKVDIWDY